MISLRRTAWMSLLASCVLYSASGAAFAADKPSADKTAPEKSAARKEAPAAKHLLRYKFLPGEIIRWQVEHRAQVRTTVSGTTQTAETYSGSVKVWQVSNVGPKGEATFVHSVESIDMRQKLTGRQEVTYNSQTDATAPPGFEAAAKSVGVPLSIITLDPRGKIVRREQKQSQPNSQAQITLPLPEQAVATGDQWDQASDIELPQKDGSVKTIKTRQRFTLTGVESGVATIHVETQVLTPIHDPAIEAQLIQHETEGNVRFDIDQGRVISQQTDLDRHVVGFQGEASSLHYVTRFVEKLLPKQQATAARPQRRPASSAGKSSRKK
jgi:hypothetical protein